MILFFVAQVGLLFFRPFARWLLAALLVITLLSDPFMGLLVLSPLEHFLAALVGLLACLTLAIAIFSPLSAAKIWPRVQPKEHAALSRLFRTLVCAPIDYKVGHLAGELFRQYNKSHGVEMPDAVTAAIAIQNQAALWTRTRKHFPMAELTLY